jgi:RNA polymerase II subunit A small phosphatase-like protein
VVLDLDETLLCPRRAPQPHQHQQQQQQHHHHWQQAGVLRPGVHAFLSALSECAEVLLWTAGGAAYAQRQLQTLDPGRRIFAGVVAGAASTGPAGAKDLSRLNRSLARTVLVDNSVASFALQPLNGVPIPPFTGDPEDRVCARARTPPCCRRLLSLGGTLRALTMHRVPQPNPQHQHIRTPQHRPTPRCLRCC